jgi:hypothetical protein
MVDRCPPSPETNGIGRHEMATWAEFAEQAPNLAEKGRTLLYGTGDGEALLASVRGAEPPRIHPIVAEVRDGALYAFILGSEKLTDLQADGRYALHVYPDAETPHEFMVRGRVRPVEATRRTELAADWPWSVGDAPAFEFLIQEAVLGERESRDDWPPRYSRWVEGR